ncbi:MAG: ATP phosphoribosyltransferase regulatory subunit, partial [Acidobacteria bacterium]|nr:ATP phosphoribosyltransferase regulatory subunit [Acidobacteriota bacterium]
MFYQFYLSAALAISIGFAVNCSAQKKSVGSSDLQANQTYGKIFEVNVPDLSGSIASGGRYDGLIGMFGKEQIPACG